MNPDLKINPEFQSLIEPLYINELSILREDLKQHGCISPIITWHGMIVDGHTRYRLCNDLHVPFRTEELSSEQFPDEDSVKIWILTNQVGRRNLSEMRRYELATERDKLLKNRALRQKRREKNLKQWKEANGQTNADSVPAEVSNLDTSESGVQEISNKTNKSTTNIRKEMAKELGVGAGTVARMDYIKKKADEGLADEDMLKKLREGKITVNKAYTEVKKKVANLSNPSPPFSPSPDPVEEVTGGRLTAPRLLSNLTELTSVLRRLKMKDIVAITPPETGEAVFSALKELHTRIERILHGR